MNRDMEKNLIARLDDLEQGKSIDAALAGDSVEAAELRPYLETAGQMSRLASLPTIAAQQQSQAAFLAEAAALASPQSAPMPIWFTLRRLMMPLASLAAILFLLGFTLVTMSAAALPGDGLYTVKLGIEEFRLMRASDPEQILVLAEQFQKERLREVEALLRAGRTADVLFEGEIEAIDLTVWIIAGLPVQIDKDTVIDGTPQVGELARVDGRTIDGQLFAAHIILLTGTPDPEEIPLPALISTLEPAETPQPSATPTVTQTPTVSPTPSPTAEIRATLVDASGDSAAITPPASVVDPPATADGSNDNDDAGDENGGSDDGSNDNDAGDDNNNNNGDDNNGNDDDDNDNDGDGDNDNDGDGDNDNDGDGDNDGDDDNDNDEDEGNSNEEDDDPDQGSDEPGDGDSDNDNDKDKSNDEEDSGYNENDDDDNE